ncbi:MAG: Bax inhibitor-1/YccA family protein [Deltaproteobacteria bacterium]|jgi:FtsH-binding integral membrane protein|nr:Bax inhibitor-1/YccA family protein [Deltaproteobacteria bacterium]
MIDFSKPPKFDTPQNGPTLNDVSQSARLEVTSEAVFFQKIYLWMCGALLVTALTGFALANSVAWLNAVRSTGFVIAIIVAQLGLVIAISFLSKSANPALLKLLFLIYSASVGCTVSLILKFYPSAVVIKAFVSASAVYGALAVYGLVTKRSLQSLGSFSFMGLVGLVVIFIINSGSPLLHFIFCLGGVLVFSLLTAYDHQKLRVIHYEGFKDNDDESRKVIIGALELYLDFINIFIFLIRLLGGRD